MDGYRSYDERDAHDFDRRGNLREHDDADHRRRRREQRDHERVRRPPHPRHRELVADVRDHRRGDADADARGDRNRIDERGYGAPACDGKGIRLRWPTNENLSTRLTGRF